MLLQREPMSDCMQRLLRTLGSLNLLMRHCCGQPATPYTSALPCTRTRYSARQRHAKPTNVRQAACLWNATERCAVQLDMGWRKQSTSPTAASRLHVRVPA